MMINPASGAHTLKQGTLRGQPAPGRPRRGCFEVRIEDGKGKTMSTVLSLLDLKRPFGKLKALDMDAVADDVRAALE